MSGQHQPKAAFGGGRYFDCKQWIGRRGLRDGQHRHNLAARCIGGSEDDGARSVLYALFLAANISLAQR